MKFTPKLYLLPIAFLLATSACTAQKKSDGSEFYTNKNSSSEQPSYTTQYIKNFDEIEMISALDIVFEESDKPYIKWSGNEVVYEQKGKKLIFSWKNNKRSGKIYIGSPKLSKALINGSGDVSITSHKSKDMQVTLNGSGNVTINIVKSQTIDAKVNGSGDINLIGELKEGKLTVNGSGEIDATKVKAEKVDCYVNGSGTIKIYAAKYVDGKVWGSGQIEHPNLKIEQKNLIISSGNFKARIN